MLMDFIRDEEGATIVEYMMLGIFATVGISILALVIGIVFLLFKVGMSL